MMKKILCLMFMGLLLSLSFSVGPEAITFPADVRSLALSGAGVGGNSSIDVNPATVTGLSQVKGVEFSHNRWFSDISGVNIRYSEFWKLPIIFELSNWESGDIGQWGNVPQDDPIGTISLHWVSAGITTGLVKNDWHFGLRLKGHFGRMVIESVKGVTADIGLQKKLMKNLTLGAVVKNLGTFSSDLLSITPPISYATGIQFTEPVTGVSLLADIVNEKYHGSFIRAGAEKSFNNITFLSGTVFSSTKQQFSFGTEYSIGQWEFGYGIAFHQNSLLGTPQFFTIGRKFK